MLPETVENPEKTINVFLRAFMECSDANRNIVRDMLLISVSPDADEDERQMAIATMADVLFPNFHQGDLGLELEESEAMGAEHSPVMKAAIAECDEQEATFARRLSA